MAHHLDDYEHVISHPYHYTAGDIECIDAIRASLGQEAFIDFCRGQVFKYMWRARLKNSLVENLKKAQWYANKALEEAQKR
jgi:hypothetical protein